MYQQRHATRNHGTPANSCTVRTLIWLLHDRPSAAGTLLVRVLRHFLDLWTSVVLLRALLLHLRAHTLLRTWDLTVETATSDLPAATHHVRRHAVHKGIIYHLIHHCIHLVHHAEEATTSGKHIASLASTKRGISKIICPQKANKGEAIPTLNYLGQVGHPAEVQCRKVPEFGVWGCARSSSLL
jgi:hypothetical protein